MENEDIIRFISKVPLFYHLKKDEYFEICKAMILKKYSRGEFVVHEDDDESHTFFIIISGRLHATVVTTEGKRTILATLKKGDFFGEMSIIDGKPRSASIVAVEDCELFMLYRESLLKILRKFPGIAIQMLIEMSTRIRHSNSQINKLSGMAVYGRIADVILELADENGRQVGNTIVIYNPPTHQEIAEMAGSSRETVSRFFSKLRKKHYIETNRKRLVILNEEKLYD